MEAKTAVRELYCYDGEQGDDPHAIVLELDERDSDHWEKVQSNIFGTAGFGRYIRVTDQKTGDTYRVASAPCGAPCHCAAVAEKVTN
jgi:hypothetical protein